MNLSERQRKVLRRHAHTLKPVVIVGRHGLTDAVVAATDEALERHELVKIRFAGCDRTERDRLVRELARRTQSLPVQRVGFVLTLYRRHPKRPRVPLS
ncbi:MAG TPA: YhbY family RNA-binding protein [Chromatiales bacterium]|nr:YhbY family RNA-binding protein [Chromatiales bacterium]